MSCGCVHACLRTKVVSLPLCCATLSANAQAPTLPAYVLSRSTAEACIIHHKQQQQQQQQMASLQGCTVLLRSSVQQAGAVAHLCGSDTSSSASPSASAFMCPKHPHIHLPQPPNSQCKARLLSSSLLVQDSSDSESEQEEGERFQAYQPSKLQIGCAHPDPVVETASLAGVEPPAITYQLHLDDVVAEVCPLAPVLGTWSSLETVQRWAAAACTSSSLCSLVWQGA